MTASFPLRAFRVAGPLPDELVCRKSSIPSVFVTCLRLQLDRFLILVFDGFLSKERLSLLYDELLENLVTSSVRDITDSPRRI